MLSTILQHAVRYLGPYVNDVFKSCKRHKEVSTGVVVVDDEMRRILHDLKDKHPELVDVFPPPEPPGAEMLYDTSAKVVSVEDTEESGDTVMLKA